MNKFKIIGFGIVCSFLIWGQINWFENNKKIEKIWNEALMNKYSEKLIFESVDVITSRSSYKRGFLFYLLKQIFI